MFTAENGTRLRMSVALVHLNPASDTAAMRPSGEGWANLDKSGEA